MQPLVTKAPSWSISRRLIFVASLGLRLLLNGARAVEKNGGKLVLFRPNENVQSVLRLAGIEKLIPIIFDRPAAIEEVLQAIQSLVSDELLAVRICERRDDARVIGWAQAGQRPIGWFVANEVDVLDCECTPQQNQVDTVV
jgi:hypothetical protein